jgi:hypothetical protein
MIIKGKMKQFIENTEQNLKDIITNENDENKK